MVISGPYAGKNSEGSLMKLPMVGDWGMVGECPLPTDEEVRGSVSGGAPA